MCNEHERAFCYTVHAAIRRSFQPQTHKLEIYFPIFFSLGKFLGNENMSIVQPRSARLLQCYVNTGEGLLILKTKNQKGE